MSDIGKTIQSIEVQEWAGTDTFKDTVTWERTVLTFTDGTQTQFDSWDGDVYGEYRCTMGSDGEPIPYDEEPDGADDEQWQTTTPSEVYRTEED